MLTPLEIDILREAREVTPLEVFRSRIARNDDRIRGANLDNGRSIAAERTAIHCALVALWAEEQHHSSGYDRPFAVVALGGTGRGEMTPVSDTDFAILVDDSLEENPFVLDLQHQIAETGNFRERFGFSCGALPFNLPDMPELEPRQLNSFLDMRPVYDPENLSARFRDRIRATYDPFQHFLTLRKLWTAQNETGAIDPEKLEDFDIKMDGLRVFLAGIWALAGRNFEPSQRIYELFGEGLADGRDLEAYYFLLRIRAFVQLRRGTHLAPHGAGFHVEDKMNFGDFTGFGEMLGPVEPGEEEARFHFANNVRARLLSARRRVARFTRGVMGRMLRGGREISPGSPIVLGTAGLRHRSPDHGASSIDKSRTALSLLLAAQRYHLPIDPAECDGTFREAGDWLKQTPEVSALFYEQNGSLADSFAFLAQLDGAEDRLFPGHAKFEVSIDRRVMAEQSTLRGPMVRRKLEILDAWLRDGRDMLARELKPSLAADQLKPVRIAVETALLDADHIAAVRLALKTKRLSFTPDDAERRGDTHLEFHERFSSGFSGTPLEDYYNHLLAGCEFPPKMLELTKFLIRNRRAFKRVARRGPRDRRTVNDFRKLCQNDENRLRALYVFTCADRAEWESSSDDPTLWFGIEELYKKIIAVFHPDSADHVETLEAQGFPPEYLAVLKDFGPALFGGGYAPFGISAGGHLAALALNENHPGPLVKMVYRNGAPILKVAARDVPGLAAMISGAFWKAGVEILQAHLFSARNHGVVLNFYHLSANEDSPLPRELPRLVETAIREEQHVGAEVRIELPESAGEVELAPWREEYRLSVDVSRDVGKAVYALALFVFRSLKGNIYGVDAQPGREGTYLSVYLRLGKGLAVDEAKQLTDTTFRKA